MRFIGIGGSIKKGYILKNKEYIVKKWVFKLELCIGRGTQQNDLGSYLSISSEIMGIL